MILRAPESPLSPPLRWVAGSLGAKLFALLLGALVLVFAVFGVLNVRLHRRDLERQTLRAAEQINHLVYRTMFHSMLRNDRDALRHMVASIGREPGIVSIRILNHEGRVGFSSDAAEVGETIAVTERACSGCHAGGEAEAELATPKLSRIYEDEAGERAIGVITPIPNGPACSQADCHAHPASQRILGILDTDLSLAEADASLRSGVRRMASHAVVAALIIAILSAIFVWLVVQARIRRLKAATLRLGAGDLGYQIPVGGEDELDELARSFNRMSRDLRDAREEVTAWGRNLEARVEQKTAELRAAHEQMMQAEKMSSLGKMAAVVAHEINNPLSGILTYARLLRRWASTPESASAKAAESREALALIESESRRCGEIVRNLLSFSRSTPLHLAPTSVASIVDQCIRLVDHKLELSSIGLHVDVGRDLPPVQADPAQLEQLFLALVMNAIEAMPDGGVLRILASAPGEGRLRIAIEDNGRGIPPDILARIFEPFVTTKEATGGVGLGLAICRGIVDRHGGSIEVESRLGQGTRFTITLPVAAAAAGDASPRRQSCRPEEFSSSTTSSPSAIP